jgi:NAD(P)-dependent dehydrogenase (short-subunit alcohol dehydrogenase family)
MELAGKSVLITGAASGIGFCTAQEFARAGCRLVLVDVNEVALNKAAERVRSGGGEVLAYALDITDRAKVEAMAQDVLVKLGGLDILINNAGIGHSAELARTSLDTWKKLIDVNLMGALHHVYAFLPPMMGRRSGHIVNVSSGQAFYRLPTWGAYASVKVALGSFSEILYYELKKHGIRVTTVYPFMVNTSFYKDVESATFAGRMSMRLLPYYSQTPEHVAHRIFKAVRKGKRVERMSLFNWIGFYSHLIPPLSGLISRIADRLLSNDAGVQTRRRGFLMKEVMTGWHEFERGFGPEGKRPMEFRVTWGPEDTGAFLDSRDTAYMKSGLTGAVTIDGLCDDAPCAGSLELRYFTDAKIVYRFEFEAAGKRYRFRGEKRHIRPWNLPVSHTTCYGELTEAENSRLVSRSVTRFRLRTIPAFLASFRLRLAPTTAGANGRTGRTSE